MESSNLPKMTDEQRKAALERSAEARRERMEFKELVKKGEISLADALADDRAGCVDPGEPGQGQPWPARRLCGDAYHSAGSGDHLYRHGYLWHHVATHTVHGRGWR